MPTTTTPSEHLSIGEVLATLRDEFPDITISKIRFLESQGLIDPERTPSGYRKFYPPDVARLRWILHQQKENFLPLKVIKGRLDEAGPGALPTDDAMATPEPAAPKAAKPAKSAKAATKRKAETAPANPDAVVAAVAAAARKTPGKVAPKPRARKPRDDEPQLELDDGSVDELEPIDGGSSLTRAELAELSGLTDAQVTELQDYGLLEPAGTGGDRMFFDEDSLAIAKVAAGFAQHGIDARHLRMYRSFAEREATLYGQVIQGVLRQRNPEARARAREDLVELAGLGRGLRLEFLRRAADQLLAE
jgi:DNA-binding transcriptional MerR regulator